MDSQTQKATSKGLNDGSMFKLDLKAMRASGNAESYLRVWLTNWQNKLTTGELEIVKRHKVLWYGQQVITPEGYPTLGIPSNKDQLIIVASTGKCGQEFIDTVALDNNEENTVLSRISGLTITQTNKDTLYYNVADEIKTAMDKFRHFGTVALGESLNNAFDQGYLHDYQMLIKWVYKKCNVVKTNESMQDYFTELDQAINGDGDTDCRILKFRAVLNKMYVHGSATERIEFPDIEGDPIVWTKKEEYSPSQSLWFLYNNWKIIEPKAWQEIEDIFRAEIGGTNYNKAMWMKHKPRLFELIDQKGKMKTNRGSINRIEEQDSDDEKVEIEIEPGMIMYISPKGPKKNRPQNWKQKVQKYQAAAKRGQRSNNSNNQNDRTRQTNNNNGPPSYWNCKFCPSQNGRTVRHNRGQKCPKNGFIPSRMIAVVQDTKENETEKEQKPEEQPEQGQLMSFQHRTRTLYDESSTDDQTEDEGY